MTTCIVLAAGFSRRLGQPKQLVDWEGEPLVRRAARIAVDAAPTIVVVAHDAVREALEGLDVTIVDNPEAGEGMASSIRRGIAACEGDVLLMLCDQPLITAQHLRALIDAKATIAATGYRGIAGVPAFFASSLRDELLALRGDVGARRIIEGHEHVVVPFEGAALDVD